jgi:hypothetical protein
MLEVREKLPQGLVEVTAIGGIRGGRQRRGGGGVGGSLAGPPLPAPACLSAPGLPGGRSGPLGGAGKGGGREGGRRAHQTLEVKWGIRGGVLAGPPPLTHQPHPPPDLPPGGLDQAGFHQVRSTLG